MTQTLKERQERQQFLTRSVPIGVEDFSELVNHPLNQGLHQGVFVDRTPWLKDLFYENAKVVAFHTFRRSGKSLTASMIEYFFSSQVKGKSTTGLFDRLEIGRSDSEFVAQHQGKYPVIAFTLKETAKSTYAQTQMAFEEKMSALYRSHNDLEHSPNLSLAQKDIYVAVAKGDFNQTHAPVSLAGSLATLSELLYCHYGCQKKVFIIIDEYDAPLVAAELGGYLEDMIPFYRDFLTAALKTNNVLQKGFLFGILRIAKESLLSGLNNPRVYTLLDPGVYQPYFGFTEDEIKSLLKKIHLPNSILTELKEWYNGYLIGDYNIYNPFSVMSFLAVGGEKPRSFWVNASSDDLLKRSLLNAGVLQKEQIRRMMKEGASISVRLSENVTFENLERDEDALWALFYAAGFLTAVEPLEPDYDDYTGYVRIPNHEVLGVYLKTFSQWLKLEIVDRGSSLDDFYTAIDVGNADSFGTWLGDFMLTNVSSHNLKREEAYHNLLIGLTAGLFKTHLVISEIEAGKGRADLIIVPRESHIKSQLAWVFEFKRAQKMSEKTVGTIIENDEESKEKSIAESLAKEALEQIDTRAYGEFLKKFPHVKQILFMGLGFAKKQVCWESRLETAGKI